MMFRPYRLSDLLPVALAGDLPTTYIVLLIKQLSSRHSLLTQQERQNLQPSRTP